MIESLLYTLALCLPCVVAAVFSDKYQKEREKNLKLMEDLEQEKEKNKQFADMLDNILINFKKSENAK